MKQFFTRAVYLFLVGLVTTSLFAEPTVYLRPEEALQIIFRDSEEVVSDSTILTAPQKLELKKKLGEPLRKETWNFFIARSGGKIDGYALVDQEVGKTEPITFLTALTPDGKVKEVEVLAYREPIGSEVRHKNFLKQYREKRPESPLIVGRDIQGITGATLSARAVSRGVRRALALWETLYGKEKR
ncbi:MAG: FMN-binding protein [Deltaproteobacteria bacterium]|nr:FMN-binding protein [Deltaproteobacteria bacterium]MBI4197005.1 FMN-binding protein [Deltaproteobacteria bacterium]